YCYLALLFLGGPTLTGKGRFVPRASCNVLFVCLNGCCGTYEICCHTRSGGPRTNSNEGFESVCCSPHVAHRDFWFDFSACGGHFDSCEVGSSHQDGARGRSPSTSKVLYEEQGRWLDPANPLHQALARLGNVLANKK